MIATVISLILLLISFVFVRSCIVLSSKKKYLRRVKANVFVYFVAIVLSLLPITRWMMIGVIPIVTAIWFYSSYFDDSYNHDTIGFTDDTIFGKIVIGIFTYKV